MEILNRFIPSKRDVLVAMVTVFEVHGDRTIPRRPFVTRLRQGPAGNLNLSFTKMLRWHEIITVVFLGRSFTLKGFLKPEEFLGGLVC